MTDRPIPADIWRSIVRNVPIVAVDLVVRHEGGVVLGRRENPPARGEWFVPGGRVQKGESIDDAVARVAREELGVAVAIDRRLGAYDHRWDESEFDDVAAKHYVAIGVVVRPQDGPIVPDDQHAELRTFEPPVPNPHPYVEAYLRDAGLRD